MSPLNCGSNVERLLVEADNIVNNIQFLNFNFMKFIIVVCGDLVKGNFLKVKPAGAT